MRLKNDDGTLRTKSVLFMFALLVWCAFAFADSYNSTQVQGVLVSSNTYAVSVPILQVRSIPFDITNASGGEVWNNSARKAWRTDLWGSSFTLGYTQAVTTSEAPTGAHSNPTSNTTLSLFVDLPANCITAGRKLRIKASGKYTSTTSPAKNLKFTTSLTGVALATTGNVSTTTGSNLAWQVESEIQVYTAGGSGTLFNVIRGTCENSGNFDSQKVGRATGSIATTVPHRLAIYAMFDASDSANAITAEDFSVESLF